jgi:hypothetical protein
MRRIGLAVILAVSLALAPFTAAAQQAVRIYRVGVLLGGPVSAVEAHVQAFRDLPVEQPTKCEVRYCSGP